MIIVKLVSWLGGWWKIKQKSISNSPLKYLYKILCYLYTEHYNGYLGSSNFSNSPSFPHGPYGVFISSGAKIGKNCVIFQQVTIGYNSLPDSKNFGSPTIGDDCYIGAGAKIIGSVVIGNNVRIGANCVVSNNIPDNSVVVLSKPRLIVKDSLENSFHAYQN